MRTTDGLRKAAKDTKGFGGWGHPVAQCPACRRWLKLPLPPVCRHCKHEFKPLPPSRT